MPAKHGSILQGTSPVTKINHYMSTPGYIMLIMLLTVLSNTLGLELIVYSLFVFLFVYICILGEDLLPLLPIVVCCYIAPSVNNNPGRNEASVFAPENGGIYLMCLGALAAAALIFRIIRDRHNFFRVKRKLLPGMLVLAGAYLLGGIGSTGYPEHASKTLLFALLNGAALIIPYFVFSGGVNWQSGRKDYLAWVGFGMGCVLLCQIGWIYITEEVVVNGVIQRTAIYTGWGMYNNIGAMLATMIPFPFFLASRHRKGWIGILAGSAFLGGTLLTCSRTSILCGSGIYFLCVILMLYYTTDRRTNTLALLLIAGSGAVVLALFSRPLLNLFSSLLDQGLDPSNRDIIYRDGLMLFSKYPIFGGSFFSTEYAPWGWSTVESFTNFLPPRWHNTFVQLLASCGVVGFGAYLFHRVQTILLFAKDRKPETIFTVASLLVLLGCSLFDCHFFNIGPVLFYSAVLACGEYH